jgi:hypothetical protein
MSMKVVTRKKAHCNGTSESSEFSNAETPLLSRNEMRMSMLDIQWIGALMAVNAKIWLHTKLAGSFVAGIVRLE